MRSFRPASIALAGLVAATIVVGGSGSAAAVRPTDVVRAQVVDAATGDGLKGVDVQIEDALITVVYGTATTNGAGKAKVRGIADEEIAVHVDGSARGYEAGYLGCLGDVVPTFAEACTFAPSNLGTIRLDPLP
jgi:hypothetical protein